jgi:hypothetical protein
MLAKTIDIDLLVIGYYLEFNEGFDFWREK